MHLGSLQRKSNILLPFYYCRGITVFQVSRYRMYWEHRVDCSFPTVAALMSRNRFEDLLQFFHAADNNNLDPNDKFAKVRPLWKLLNARWVKYYPGDKI